MHVDLCLSVLPYTKDKDNILVDTFWPKKGVTLNFHKFHNKNALVQ